MLLVAQPIENAPMDGSSLRVPEFGGYRYAFYQDGYWWWHTNTLSSDYAVGPIPDGWFYIVDVSQ